ncbi:hypothetical protein FF1_018359 [Malus domestica]
MRNQILRTTKDGLDRCWWKMEALSLMFSEQIILIGKAYTCWSQSTGAEEFNYGSRIDHILCAGACLHQEQDLQSHNFVTCHVKEFDILTQFKWWKTREFTKVEGRAEHETRRLRSCASLDKFTGNS